MHHSIKMGDRGSKKLDRIVSMPNLSIKKGLKGSTNEDHVIFDATRVAVFELESTASENKKKRIFYGNRVLSIK